VPGTGWLGFEDEPVTWGGLILGLTGLVLLFLALSGLWLWFPKRVSGFGVGYGYLPILLPLAGLWLIRRSGRAVDR
jgi:hypothetical protein